MTEVKLLASEITSRCGTVKRARGCFLYTAKGVRLTDLYQEGGRAILGWGGGSAFTVLKNVLSRGITGSYDTDFSPRSDGSGISQLDRAVSDLLAGPRHCIVLTSRRRALEQALAYSPDSTSFWRPWNPDLTDWRSVDAVIIEPPLPWTSSIWLLAVRDDSTISSDAVPAPIAAAVTRSLYDMIAALQIREEKDWFIYDPVVTKYWTRRGPYLFPKVPREVYGNFLLHCLNCGIVISPVYEQPSIVPFGADRGVFRALEKTPFISE